MTQPFPSHGAGVHARCCGRLQWDAGPLQNRVGGAALGAIACGHGVVGASDGRPHLLFGYLGRVELDGGLFGADLELDVADSGELVYLTGNVVDSAPSEGGRNGLDDGFV